MDKKMEPLIYEVTSGHLETKFGKFKIYYFSDGREDALALVKGDDIYGAEDVLCRIHSQCLLAEAFYSTECDCAEQLELALKAIQTYGGILIYLFQNGRGHGLAPLISTQELKEKGMTQQEAYERKGFYGIERSFDIAAKILLYFNIASVKLITKNKDKFKSIEKYGIEVSAAQLNSSIVIFDKKIRNQSSYKNIELMPITNKTLVVISDLNVDEVLNISDDEDNVSDLAKNIHKIAGGCALNSAHIFKHQELDPIILSSVGDDSDGTFILEELEKNNIKAFIYKSRRATGRSTICYMNGSRKMKIQAENANEYDSTIATMMDALRLSSDNFVYITIHMLFRGTKENVRKIRDSIYRSNAKIVVDIVPHDIHKNISWEYFCEIFHKPVFMIICELKTMVSFFDELPYAIGEEEQIDDQIFTDVLEKVSFSNIHTEYFVLRYGYENIGKQRVYRKADAKFIQCSDEETGFRDVRPEDRRGYGEILTVNLLKKYHYEVDNDHKL